MQAEARDSIEMSSMDARLAAVTHLLLQHSAVEDCAALCRFTEGGDPEILAYIVPSGPFVPDRLHAYLLGAGPEGLMPSAYIPLSAMPLTSAGQADTAALLELPVYDSALIARWETQLCSEPGMEDVGVMVLDYSEPLASVHLSDLLPAGEFARAEESGEVTANVGAPRQARTAPIRPMAMSDGGPLEIPDDAPTTFTEAIQRTAARYPTRGVTYVRSDGSELFQSYATLLTEAKCILTGLQKQGMKPGDRVILQVEALQDHFASFWACVLGGITPVTVAVAPSYAEPNGIVNKLYNTWKLLEQPVVLTNAALIAPISGLVDLLDMQGIRVLSVDELKANPPSEAIYPSKPEDLVFFQLSSGSTGIPKCIQERHQAVICHIHGSQQFNAYTPDNISLNWLPVDHVVPILTVHLKDVYLGCSQVHVRTDLILSHPLKWLDLLEAHRATHTWAPNFGFKLLADHLRDRPERAWDLSSVKFFMNAGEQVTLPVVREFLQLTAPFGVSEQAMQPAFGMAEACTCMTYRNDFRIETDVHRFLKSSLSSDLIEAEPGDSSVTDFVDLGPPMPGVQIRITDSDNRPVREGVIGRFQIKGGVIMPGYLNNEAANREAFVGDGWFNSGDLGFILNGSLTLTGREKEMIIVRGANFYCYEIEDVVNTIPGVEPTFVGASAVEDPATGSEGLAIFFVPRVSSMRDQVQVIKAIKMRITASLGITPAFVIPLPKREFPKTTSGKIQRTQMKKSLLAGAYNAILKEIDVALNNTNTLPAWFYRTVWRRKEVVAAAPVRADGATLVFLDREGLGERLALLPGADIDGVGVEAGPGFARSGPNRFVLNPESPADYHRLVAILHGEGRAVTEVLHLWNYTTQQPNPTEIPDIEMVQVQGMMSLVHLVQALAQNQGPDYSVRILVASTYAQPTSPQEPIAWEKAPLIGLIKTVSQEMPYLDCRSIDLTGDSVAEDAERLTQELSSDGDREVAYRGGYRLISRLERVDLPSLPQRSSPLKSGGMYLLTGGLGGIALEIARYLIKRYDAHLLLVGRTPLPERADWALTHPTAIQERIEALLSLEALGGKVRYETVDVSDSDQLRAAVSRAEEQWECRLDGAFHLAGLYRDRLLVEETAESLAAVLRPKMMGALALHRLLEDRPDCLFVAFSSTTSFFGGAMFGAYAAANRFLDHFCHWRGQQLGRPTHCFAWSTWNEIGMNRTISGKEPLRATGRGFLEMSAEQGLNSLLAGLVYDQPQLLIGLEGSSAAIRRHIEGLSPHTQQLCACFTARTDGASLSQCETLVVPDRFGTSSLCTFMQVGQIPRLSSGEIDRLALAEIGRQAFRGGAERVAPRSEQERQTAQVWQEVLGVPQIGVHDNFFELGGHSLLATLVTSRLAEVFHADLPVRLLFESPTVAGLTAKIMVMQADVCPTPTQALVPLRRDQALPLSFAQQRIWFVEQLESGSPAHNISLATCLIGTLDVSALERSLNEIFRRHEALRTTFPTRDGKPTLSIAPPTTLSLPIVDLSHLMPGERETETLRLAAMDLRTPFNIATGPLIRVHLVRRDSQDHALLVNVHHIVADGWSLGVFNQELSALYAAFVTGQSSPLPELPVQYADYALWQRNELRGETLERQLKYWKQQIEDVPTLLELPLDHLRPPVQTFRGAHQSFALSQELTERLKALCRQEGVTLFMTLMAAFQALLARHSGQEKFLVSTGVANRNRKETENLIGCFINILLLRADVTGDPSFRELLARVRETALGAYANQDLPFEKLVEEVQPERDLSYNPLTQVMFVLLNAPIQSQNFPGIRTEPLDIETAAAQYDLVIHMVETPDGMTGYLDYYTDLFEPETIDRMLGHFQTLLEAIVLDADLPVARIPLLTSAERQQLLVAFNDSHVDFGQPQPLHRYFEAHAERLPTAPAVFFGEETLTYAELDARANRLARHLQELGVGPDMPVGLAVERSLEMVIGILGILKAGGAYVPLDPAYPQERLAFMLEDSRTQVLVTQAHLRDRLPQSDARVVCLDSEWPRLAALNPERPSCGVTPENLSYIIYTSGSTGQPKGIAIRHAGVGNNLLDLNTRFGVNPADRVLALSSLSFDMCVYEVLGALCAGAGIVMPAQDQLREPLEWAHLIQKHGVTLWNSAPALLKMLVDLVEAREDLWPRSLRLALMGGDWVPITLPERLKAMAPDVRFIVMGGATEASIHSTLYEVEETDPTWRSIPYGHAMANQTTFILDGNQQLVPIGVPGELHLGGVGLGRGYWNRPELTEQKFIPHPFATGERLYRTGDLARWRPDGEIELLGRIDYMVKIRGLRIELGEIEALLRRHPAVLEAVVTAKGPDSDKRLIAYVVPGHRAAQAVRLVDYEKAGLLDGRRYGQMPNGMTVVYQNQNELDFGYKEIFEAEGYLQHGVHLEDGACVFDIGANIGLFSLYVGQRCKNATVYAFEPIPPVFETLRLNAGLYSLDMRLFNCGLADSARSENLTYYPHLSLISGRFADDAAQRQTVKAFLANEHDLDIADDLLDELLAERLQGEQVLCEMKTISQVIRDNGVDRIDLLKIDVEKAEADVLAGIEAEHWPLIRQVVLEVYNIEGRLGRIVAMLTERGFAVTVEQDDMLKETPFHNIFAVRENDARSAVESSPNEVCAIAAETWDTPEEVIQSLRTWVKAQLPDYMTPSAFVLLDRLPLSPNGKVDRKALPMPEMSEAVGRAVFTASRTPTEEILAGIWAAVLGTGQIGIHDSFFEIGGHSLLATQVISRIRDAFQVEIPVRTLFEAPTISQLAECVERNRQSGERTIAPPITPVPREGLMPVSFAQQRIWIVDQLSPGGNASYNIPVAAHLSGTLDISALERSLNEIIRRHEILRTTFVMERGVPVQVIAPPPPVVMPVIDLSHLPEADRMSEALRQSAEDLRTPFHLAQGPLLRIRLFRISQEEHLLLLVSHHIVSDGWSISVFNQELAAIYAAFVQGRPSPLPELPAQYADYAVWQRQWLQGEVLEKQLAYWKQHLANAPTRIDLPTNRPRPAVQSFRGARHTFALPPDLASEIKTFSQAQGATLYMTLLAAFKALLSSYTGADDIVVGSPTAGRTRVETESMVGFFINTLVLRTSLAESPSFSQLIRRIREVILGATAHQEVQFDRIVEILRPPRDRSRNPVFQVNFRVQTASPAPLTLPGLTARPVDVLDFATSKFDLALDLTAVEGLHGYIEYNTDLFDPDTIAAVSEDFESVLRTVLREPQKPLTTLDLPRSPVNRVVARN